MNRAPFSTSIPGDGRREGMAASDVASNLPAAPIGAHPEAAQQNHHQRHRNEERIAPVGRSTVARPTGTNASGDPPSSTAKDPPSASSSPPTKDTPTTSTSRPAENKTDQVEVLEDPSSSPPRQNQVSQEGSRGDQEEEAHGVDVNANDIGDDEQLQQEGDEGVGRLQQEAPPRPISRRTNSSGRDKHHLAMARDILDGISDDDDSDDDEDSDDDDSIGDREGPMPAYSLPQ